MDISAISPSLLQQISNGATQPGDSVSLTMLRKALDIQAAQAGQMIESVSKTAPAADARLGANIDIRV